MFRILIASAAALAMAFPSPVLAQDGIGKTYMGREIAQVMGHPAAGWLERPERQQEERPDLLLRELELKPGMVAADVGAGTGYYTSRLARAVGESGRVYAVDVQPEMLELLAANMARQDIRNFKPVLATPRDPRLPPNSVDLILLVDVYHELEYPREVLEKLVAALAPGGRIAFVEYRAEDPRVPIKTLHKMSEAQIRKEAEVFELSWQRTYRGLPWQHLVIFRKS